MQAAKIDDDFIINFGELFLMFVSLLVCSVCVYLFAPVSTDILKYGDTSQIFSFEQKNTPNKTKDKNKRKSWFKRATNHKESSHDYPPKEGSTIEEVFKTVAIFGYLFKIYFTNKISSMKKSLVNPKKGITSFVHMIRSPRRNHVDPPYTRMKALCN